MTDYFSGATKSGRLFNINGVVWLVHSPVKIVNLQGEEEYGWDANDLSNNAAYHFFTQSEIKENNLVIKEF